MPLILIDVCRALDASATHAEVMIVESQGLVSFFYLSHVFMKFGVIKMEVVSAFEARFSLVQVCVNLGNGPKPVIVCNGNDRAIMMKIKYVCK